MKTPALLLLAALLAVSTAASAKGVKIRGGGSHHNTTSHSEPSGGSTYIPRPHVTSSSEPAPGSTEAQQAAEERMNAAREKRAAAMDRLNAELAAKRAATPPGAPVGQLVAMPAVTEPAPLAANEKRLTRPVTVGKVAAIAPSSGADITTLVPKDSSAKPHDDFRRDDRYNGQGVNCSLYPSRC